MHDIKLKTINFIFKKNVHIIWKNEKEIRLMVAPRRKNDKIEKIYIYRKIKEKNMSIKNFIYF